MNDLLYWFWLCNIKGLGSKKIETLLKIFELPKQIWDANDKELNAISILSANDIKSIKTSKNKDLIQENYNKLEQRNIRFISIADNDYPNKLKHIYNPPYGIYVKGKIPQEDKPSIAIVGARKCTSYGREMAKYYGRELAKNGFQIISGLASGIDSAAHKGALEANGITCGVLGNGINITYPKENLELILDMEENGGVITEYNLDIPPKASHFPLRNRIISGVSDGILVIEAAEKSGSLITAELGLEFGKEIFALPGRTIDPLSKGTNNLIKQGANMVLQVSDIIEEFKDRIYHNDKTIETKNEKILKMLEKNEELVYDSLSLEPKHIDVIINELQLSIQEITHTLLMLELKGLVKQLPNKYFIINV